MILSGMYGTCMTGEEPKFEWASHPRSSRTKTFCIFCLWLFGFPPLGFPPPGIWYLFSSRNSYYNHCVAVVASSSIKSLVYPFRRLIYEFGEKVIVFLVVQCTSVFFPSRKQISPLGCEKSHLYKKNILPTKKENVHQISRLAHS